MTDYAKQQKEFDKISSQINQDWWAGENIDTTGMSVEKQKALGVYKEPKKGTGTSLSDWGDDGWGGVADYNRGKTSFDINADPTIAEELARKDPEFRLKLNDMKMEEVVLEFRSLNKDYLPNEKNLSEILQYLRNNQLKDPILDEEDVMATAFDAGIWTVANLTTIFKTLTAQGKLEMPQGKMKTLTDDERLHVISDIRFGDNEAAVINYITFAFGGRLPREYRSPQDFCRAHPALSNQAAQFVFFHSKATISPAEWRIFQKECLAGKQLLTYKLLDEIWSDWKFNQQQGYTTKPTASNPEPEPAPRELTREELEKLSDAEIEDLRIQAVREYRKAQYS